MEPNTNSNTPNDTKEFNPDPALDSAPAPAPANNLPKVQPDNIGEDSTPAPSPTYTSSAPVVSGGFSDEEQPALSNKKSPKAAILGAAGVVLLALLGAGYYFGYYTNSSVVYAQSLSNTGKGLTTLTNQLTAQPKIAYKGYTGSGTYKIDSNGTSTDGKFSFKSTDENSDSQFDVGLGTSRVNVDIRTIKSVGLHPDIYFKASGLTGLSSSMGSPELEKIADKYNDKWIVVDHTLIDNLQKQYTDTSNFALPTSEQIMDEVHAANNVNQDYLFSTSKDKAVTTIIKTYGMETVDGHKVIHYQVGFNKPNLKKYITAQNQALLNSKLNDWIKQNKLSDKVKSSYEDALKSVDNIKPSDTFDMYSDINSRLVYKFKFSDKKNPATNYVDVGLDYKNNQELPFFVTGVAKEGADTTNYSFKVKSNAKTKAVNVDILINKTGSSKSNISSSFSFSPTAVAPVIITPTGAYQVAELMQELGLGSPDNLMSGR